jgi:hypothetical protein
MSISKAAGTAAALVDSTSLRAVERHEAPTGWDPYDVWRTRVLGQPRQPTDQTAANRRDTAGKPVLLRSA